MSKNNVNTLENVDVVEEIQAVAPQKKKENVKAAEIWKKTVDLGKRASDGIQKGAKNIVDKTKEDRYAQRMKKYNPLFEEQYRDPNFKIPNMIVIVDDAVRKGIDVCEGAIGWLSKEDGMEVLHLYDEAIQLSGLHFVPAATCDTIYYVDNFDRTRFIQVDCLFAKAHEEKIAELEHIAYSLGAKSITIEIIESNKKYETSQQGMEQYTEVKTKKAGAKSAERFENEAHLQTMNVRSGRNTTRFSGNDVPVRPALKWYANDDNIKGLIEMRCSSSNSIQNKSLVLEGSSSATMSKKTACAIDNAVKYMNNEAKNKASAIMEKQASEENSSKLVLNIEF